MRVCVCVGMKQERKMRFFGCVRFEIDASDTSK